MRRSPNIPDHALQPGEYLDEAERLIETIAAQRGIELKQTDSSEPQLELILRYIVKSGRALGAAFNGVPADDKEAD